MGPYVQGIQREPEPEQALYKSYYFDQYKRKFDFKPPPKSLHRESDATMDFSQSIKTFSKLDKSHNEAQMRDYQPL